MRHVESGQRVRGCSNYRGESEIFMRETGGVVSEEPHKQIGRWGLLWYRTDTWSYSNMLKPRQERFAQLVTQSTVKYYPIELGDEGKGNNLCCITKLYESP